MNRVETCLASLIRLYIKVPYKIIKSVKKYPRTLYLKEIAKAISDKEFDILFRIRPKDGREQKYLDYKGVLPKFAIVLQGPIRHEDSFTLNTVRYYHKMYSSAVVIVSTWNDEDLATVRKLESAGASVILNEKPIYGGHRNINYQLVSSRAGIEAAYQMGLKYICKSRTDQRLGKAHIFETLLNLINMFPSGDGQKQKQRIIALSMVYGNMFFPYLVSDFLYFGSADDIRKMFEVPLDQRESFSMKKKATRRDYSEAVDPPEVYILQNYLRRIGVPCNCSIKDYWEALKKYLICIDRKMVDLIWPKYEGMYLEHEYFGDYFIDDFEDCLKTMNFDFTNWVNLYSGSLIYKPEYETMMDKVFR